MLRVVPKKTTRHARHLLKNNPFSLPPPQLHAHEGCLIQIDDTDTYLWYGVAQPASAVNLYTSHDLASWRRRSPVVRTLQNIARLAESLL